MEFKTFPLKFEEVTDGGIIRGYASTFGNVDLGLDVVDKGAFKKSIKENGGKVPILWQHNPNELLGFNARAEEDDHGLFVEGELNLDVARAREAHSLAKQALRMKTPMGLSIGYGTIKAEPDREKPIIRRLKELKLYEYSQVTFPMNTEAMITAAKSLGNVDRAKFLLEQLTNNGISREELAQALSMKAAGAEDPSELAQSMQSLINSMKV